MKVLETEVKVREDCEDCDEDVGRQCLVAVVVARPFQYGTAGGVLSLHPWAPEGHFPGTEK